MHQLINKIVRFIRSITLEKVLRCIFAVLFLWIAVCDIQNEYKVRKYEKVLRNIRSQIVNDICNKGEGNYDFCILEKAEYTYSEGKYNNN